MRRSFSFFATLLLPLALSTPAGAGFGFHCDAATGVAVLNVQPSAAQDQYLAAKAYNGACKTVDRKQAEAWYQKAAAQGHKDAQYELAEMYFTGLGIPLNYPEAKKWYLKAAEQGHAASQLRLGFLFAEKHFEGLTADLVEAEKWFTKAAEQDVKDSRFRLGNFYISYTQPPDLVNGRLWLQRAADSGHHTAMYDLGRLLVKQKETAKGIEWITKAAEENDLQAQMTLAEIYEAGREVPFNPDEFVKWVLRIAGHPAAPIFYLNKAGDILFDGLGETPRNYPAARKYYERAASKGDTTALRQLAVIYKRGLGVAKDLDKAKKLLDRAEGIK